LVSGALDTADYKIGDLIVEYLGEFESILEKVLIHVSGAQMKLLIILACRLFLFL
jgi:hypothetical protein